MDVEKQYAIANSVNNISRYLIGRNAKKSKFKNTHTPIKKIKNIMNKNKISLRKNVKRKIKRLENIAKSAAQISPCLIGALAAQEKCILNNGNTGSNTNYLFDKVCSQDSVQKVIQNWNPDPTTKEYLYENDPNYKIKKKQRDEGKRVGWYSSINGCGQTIENKLLEVSTEKDNKSQLKEKKRRFLLTDEQRKTEDKQLADFYRKYENNQDKANEQQNILIGGKYRKTKKKTRKTKKKTRKTKSKTKKHGKRRRSRRRRRRKNIK